MVVLEEESQKNDVILLDKFEVHYELEFYEVDGCKKRREGRRNQRQEVLDSFQIRKISYFDPHIFKSQLWSYQRDHEVSSPFLVTQTRSRIQIPLGDLSQVFQNKQCLIK